MEPYKINIGYARDVMQTLGLLKDNDMTTEEIEELYYLNLCKNTMHTLMCKNTEHGEGGCDFYELKDGKAQEMWKEKVKEEATNLDLSYCEMSDSLRKILSALTSLNEKEQILLKKILIQSQERAQVHLTSESDSSSSTSSVLGEVPDSLSFVPDPSQ